MSQIGSSAYENRARVQQFRTLPSRTLHLRGRRLHNTHGSHCLAAQNFFPALMLTLPILTEELEILPSPCPNLPSRTLSKRTQNRTYNLTKDTWGSTYDVTWKTHDRNTYKGSDSWRKTWPKCLMDKSPFNAFASQPLSSQPCLHCVQPCVFQRVGGGGAVESWSVLTHVTCLRVSWRDVRVCFCHIFLFLC